MGLKVSSHQFLLLANPNGELDISAKIMDLFYFEFLIYLDFPELIILHVNFFSGTQHMFILIFKILLYSILQS